MTHAGSARDTGSMGIIRGMQQRPLFSVIMVALVSLIAQADRIVLAVLMIPIQQEMNVSDSTMGLLTGIVFSLVYASVAFPMARFADFGTRRKVIAAAVAVWSGATILCGLASNITHLILARAAVAAGEGSAFPSQVSMVSDLYPASRRGFAMGIMTVGTALGLSAGALVAATIGEQFGWRWAFFVLGALGVILSLFFALMVPEPAREDSLNSTGPSDAKAAQSTFSTLREIGRIKTAPRLLLATIFQMVAFSGFTAWLPAYLIRNHSMSLTEMSVWYSMGPVLGAATGLLLGLVSDRVGRKGTRFRCILLSAMCFASVPVLAALFLSKTIGVVIVMMILFPIVAGGLTSVLLATATHIVAPRLRGSFSASLSFCMSVLGGGLGPMLIGILNDEVKLHYGALSLRFSLLLLPACLLIAGAFYLWAARSADGDADAAMGK